MSPTRPTPDGRTAVRPNLTGELQLDFLDRLRRRDLRVVRVEDVTPRYRRVVLGGDDLADGFPLVPFAPSDHVKVYFPHPVTGRIVSYRETGDDEWEVDGDGPPIRRDYTPRAFDPVARELSLDFVLHDHGVAGRWAARAHVGDPLVVIGPRANWLLPDDYAHYVAAGDETAIPAISRILEEAPATATVTALVEVTGAADEQPIGGTPGREVRWVHRSTAPVADGHLSALETAVKGLALPGPLDSVFVFAAGEAGTIKPIRRYLRRDVGLPTRQLLVDGYWKRGTPDFDHHVVDADEE